MNLNERDRHCGKLKEVLFLQIVLQFKDMETIQIRLSPNANKAKLIEAIEMLKGVKGVIVTKTDGSVKASDNYVKKSIEAGLQDAKDIITGKKKGKTLKQLLDED